MAAFSDVLNDIMDFEGGYVNDPDDPGSETKYGISKTQYPNIDIKNLTFAEASSILEKDYWNRYRLSEINSQLIANKLFLAFINLSPLSVARRVQTALNNCGANVMTDGVLGTASITAINYILEARLLDAIRVELMRLYLYRVKTAPIKIKYLEGWGWRAIN